LTEFGEETIALIDQSLKDLPAVDPTPAAKAIKNIWLWTLAAYEVTRTLHQRKEIFTQNTACQLGQLKRQLSTLRMPMAKLFDAFLVTYANIKPKDIDVDELQKFHKSNP
jgi:hypothetical protein